MSEIKYIPPSEKQNQGIQRVFIGPKRYIQRRFFVLISVDRYSRWPAACTCKTPTGRTVKTFLEQNLIINGIPQTIKANKGTAFTGGEFREIVCICKK